MHAADLVQDFARRAQLQQLRLNEQGTAELVVDGAMTLCLEHDTVEQALHVMLGLGTLPAGGREPLMRAVLRHNLLGRGSGGGAWALDAQADDELMLQRSLPLATTDGLALEHAVLAMIGAARALQAELERTDFTEDEGPALSQAVPDRMALDPLHRA